MFLSLYLTSVSHSSNALQYSLFNRAQKGLQSLSATYPCLNLNWPWTSIYNLPLCRGTSYSLPYTRAPREGNNQKLPQHLNQIAALSSQEALGKDDRVRQFCHLHLSSTPQLEHPTQRSHSSLPTSSRSATTIAVEEHCDQRFQPRDSPPLTLTKSQLSVGELQRTWDLCSLEGIVKLVLSQTKEALRPLTQDSAVWQPKH